MKKTLFLFFLMLSPMLASAQTVADVQNSGCVDEARGEGSQRTPTIVLEKEGSVLSVQLLNYKENCCAQDFNVTSSVSGGSDGEPCSLFINVGLADEYGCSCICPFNVSFTVRDLEPNSFYLDCWWYKGKVSLTDGIPLVLYEQKSMYRPIVEEGKHWTVDDFMPLRPAEYDHYYYYDLKGDTLIAGKNCLKMYSDNLMNSS